MISVGVKPNEDTKQYPCKEANTFIQKSTEQRRQGNDACIEQVIKRSKKGANIKVCMMIFENLKVHNVLNFTLHYRTWTVEGGSLSFGV